MVALASLHLDAGAAPVASAPADAQLPGKLASRSWAANERAKDTDQADAKLKGVRGEAFGFGGSSTGGYEGLPARIAIPAGARQSGFYRELLATDTAHQAVVVVISARLLASLAAAAFALLVLVGVLLRRDLGAGARTYAARFRAPAAA